MLHKFKMHVCLSIPEILAMICNELAPSDDLNGEVHDLDAPAMLARTLRTFSEPALDALWNGLGPSILPLLRCIIYAI
jgi:hypothetical protein